MSFTLSDIVKEVNKRDPLHYITEGNGFEELVIASVKELLNEHGDTCVGYKFQHLIDEDNK